MGSAIRCINGHPVNLDEPRLTFGAKTFKGSNVMCWICLTGEMTMHFGVNIERWLVEFIEAHTDPMIVAKNRIAELEARLAQANKVVEDQRRILKLQEAL